MLKRLERLGVVTKFQSYEWSVIGVKHHYMLVVGVRNL